MVGKCSLVLKTIQTTRVFYIKLRQLYTIQTLDVTKYRSKLVTHVKNVP